MKQLTVLVKCKKASESDSMQNKKGDFMKKICAFIVTLLVGMGCFVTAAHAAVTNPFLVTGTDIEKGTKNFVISIQLSEAVRLSAYELSVTYDNSVLEVAGAEETGYFYSEEFKNYYDGGYLACNDKNHSEVIFAGAKLNAGEYSGTVAKVCFRVKNTSHIATDITLHVKAVGMEDTAGVVQLDISNPKKQYNVVLNEYQGVYGDVNADGEITLEDAQYTLKAALKIITFSAEQKIAGDMNSDGVVTLEDAQIILKKALKIIA